MIVSALYSEVVTTEPRPLPGDISRHQLPKRAIGYMRVQALLVWGLLTIAAIVGAAAWSGLPDAVRWAVPLVLLAMTTGSAFVEPPIRYRTFWYAISPEEVDLRHGWFILRRTVVPMNRVQHLTVSQGPLAVRFKLAKISIHTAAGEITLEPLDHDEAEELRVRIAALAGLSDDV